MSRVIDLVNDAQAAAVGIVPMTASHGSGTISKIPTRGHFHFTLTSIQGAADTAEVQLKGTNNPDPTSTDGETLITNSHTASDQEDGSAGPKGYKYVFVEVTAEGAGAGADFAAGSIKVFGTGFSGTT